MLFSATLDDAVDVLVRRYQTDPVVHRLPDREEESGTIDHRFERVGAHDRLDRCVDAIKRSGGPTIVFCRTKRRTDRIARDLGRAGVKTAVIHGNRSQNQRDQALASFTKGKVEALVATDVAARGIHVDGVTCVVHFDPPNDAKDYTHRSGRTARAGARGTVVSLVDADQRADVAKIQRALGLPVDGKTVDGKAVEALRHTKPGNEKPRNTGSRGGQRSGRSRSRGRGRGQRGNARRAA
jgi:superfamily II DNA/RNA helicase